MKYLKLLNDGVIRTVGLQRKRKLRKLGENVRWCHELNSFIWFPGESNRREKP
jgi:hypothetical protein